MKFLVSFDVSALSTSIPVPVALKVINLKFTEHINQIGTYDFLENACFKPKDNVISLLELVDNNYVLSFKGKLYQQFQGAAVGPSVSAVIVNICMKYFEELVLGLEFPIHLLLCKAAFLSYSLLLGLSRGLASQGSES